MHEDCPYVVRYDIFSPTDTMPNASCKQKLYLQLDLKQNHDTVWSNKEQGWSWRCRKYLGSGKGKKRKTKKPLSDSEAFIKGHHRDLSGFSVYTETAHERAMEEKAS